MDDLILLDPQNGKILLNRWHGVMSGNRKAAMHVQWPGTTACR
jgi:hypothetical protein